MRSVSGVGTETPCADTPGASGLPGDEPGCSISHFPSGPYTPVMGARHAAIGEGVHAAQPHFAAPRTCADHHAHAESAETIGEGFAV